MTNSKRLLSKVFYNSFGYSILFSAKLFLKSNFMLCSWICLRLMLATQCTLKQQQLCQTMLKLLISVKFTSSAICLTKTVPVFCSYIPFNHGNNAK